MFIEPGNIQLAPAYDIVSTVVYQGLHGNMAMKIADKRTLGQVMRRHWERLADDAGIGAAQLRVTVERLAAQMPSMAARLRVQFEADGVGRPVLERICTHVESRCMQALVNLGH